MKTDFYLQDEGSIAILIPLSDAAEDWVAEHLPEDATRWGNGVVVEHRYVAPIVDGLTADGLSIE